MTRTVLVADDSPTIQNKAKGILTGEGLDVITVSNGVAAIKKLPQVMPVLILADVSMPGRDGYEVCDFVKNSPELRHIPVLLIFSDTDPYNEEQAARVHADGKIQKMAAGRPFNPEELISAVSGIISRASAAEPESSAGPEAEAPTLVTEPTDAEPEVRQRKGMDWDGLPQGVAIADPGAEEATSLEHAGAASEPEHAVWSAAGGEAAEAPAQAHAPAEEATHGGEEPVLIEEPVEEMPPPTPRTQRTVIFRAPAEIAEPRLHDELSPQPLAPSDPPAPPPPAPETSECETVAASTLESFSLTAATAGEVRFASPESESPAEAEPPPEATPEAETAPETAVDSDLVHSIVRRVVVRMAPPALASDAVDEMARRIAYEIIAELAAGSS